ncbi:hypothetical protein O181_027110 [Austropuccinia psidii MF-1]|uniref:Retrotransposon gag domain-containing protein n=1 Tax=Austropuccinia psidii MF-1 TaxID=1389203 RepID=A0A9Q3CQI2_9BASI|nr:hypothetical protein [Austropuccinia psidii MF-1]
MPIQHSPPRQTISQARTQAVLTPTRRAPLDVTPAVPQLRAQLDRGPHMEGAAPSRKERRGPKRSSSCLEVVPYNFKEHFQGSDGTEGAPAPVGVPQGTGGPTLAQSDQPVSHQSETSSLAIRQQMTQIMANLQAASSYESLIQSCQLIFHNDPENFSQDKNKVLYVTSFLIDRATKWNEPYISNLTNQDPNCLHNSWNLFESQLFALFGDPNEGRKAEAELHSLRMIEGGHVSLYIADFRSLVSRIGDWGERDLIHHFRKVFPSRILDHVASHSLGIDSLQELMEVTLELDTRYHERQKEKSNHQE